MPIRVCEGSIDDRIAMACAPHIQGLLNFSTQIDHNLDQLLRIGRLLAETHISDGLETRPVPRLRLRRLTLLLARVAI